MERHMMTHKDSGPYADIVCCGIASSIKDDYDSDMTNDGAKV